jgi:hypothetical protein
LKVQTHDGPSPEAANMAIFRLRHPYLDAEGCPETTDRASSSVRLCCLQGLKGENMSLIFRYLDPSLVIYSVKYSKGPTKQAVPGSKQKKKQLNT